MPIIVLLDLLVALFLMNHVRETGRPQYWYFLILAVPVVGSIAYVCFELIPDMGNTRRGQRVTRGISDILAPDREFDRLHDAAKTTSSVETKRALAEECERKGMWEEAERLYETAAQGIYADDTPLLVGLARSQINGGDAQRAMATLERLRAAHPDLDNQDAHLIYARCLEALGRIADAEAEYSHLSGYYVGLEARTRYAQFLARNGNVAKARELFESVVRASAARAIVLTEADKIWLKVARDNL
jgi:hypothetical protein